jgi:hypothetical protein
LTAAWSGNCCILAGWALSPTRATGSGSFCGELRRQHAHVALGGAAPTPPDLHPDGRPSWPRSIEPRRGWPPTSSPVGRANADVPADDSDGAPVRPPMSDLPVS